jgi:hypothetical protein
VKEIDIEHPEYRERRRAYRMYRHLYRGGELMKSNAADYLTRRQKEPGEVYQERLNQVYYENYVGSIIDWYVASVFRREAVILADGKDEAGRKFLNEFVEDCDLKGSTLAEFFRARLRDSMVYGVSHMVVDFPRVKQEARTRAEEERMGAGRAYLVECSPEQVINWSLDERGNYEWVVVRTERTRQASVEDARMVEQTRWYYYDRERFRVYGRERVEGGLQGGLGSRLQPEGLPHQGEGLHHGGDIELLDEGVHGWAALGRVPLVSLSAADGLWLMEKAGLLQLEHFNKSNALSWALTMGLFATPVVYTEREWSQVVGESYYIQLGPNDKFGWTEPEGKVYQIAADNLGRLKEEIYRVCYVLSQAGGPVTSQLAQSGLSKQRDFAITQEVLRAYGDWVKDGMKKVLGALIAVRGDGVGVDVSGVDEFDIGDFAGEISDAERLLALGIESETLRKQVHKKLAFQYLSDLRQGMKERIGGEIERGGER